MMSNNITIRQDGLYWEVRKGTHIVYKGKNEKKAHAIYSWQMLNK